MSGMSGMLEQIIDLERKYNIKWGIESIWKK
jgi:hypothetical protein